MPRLGLAPQITSMGQVRYYTTAASIRRTGAVYADRVCIGDRVFTWVAGAQGGLDTGTEYSNVLAITGVTTGAYIQSAASNPGWLSELIVELNDYAASAIIDGGFSDLIHPSVTSISSWPSTFGGPGLTAAGAGAAFTRQTDPRTGNACVCCDSIRDQSLNSASGVAESLLTVSRIRGAMGGGDMAMIAAIGASKYVLGAGPNAKIWDVSAGYGSPVHYRNGVANRAIGNGELSVYEGVISGNLTAGCKIGGYSGFAMSFPADHYAWLQLKTLTSTQRANIANALKRAYGILDPVGIWIDGNSLAIGHYSAYTPRWYGDDVWLTDEKYSRYNSASAGKTLTQVASDFATNMAAYSWGFTNKVYVLYEDTNSIVTSGWTADQVVTANWNIAATARAAGFKVILTTCIGGTGFNTAQDAVRVAANAAKLAGWASHADGIVDLAAVPEFVSTTTPSEIRYDNLHLTDKGYRIFGHHLAKGIRALV